MVGVGDNVGFDDRGNGAPVVLLHPFPFTREIWAGTAEALAAHFRVIAVDARGFGESPLRGPYALTDLADDLAALLDERKIARATVVGMSMGGYTALAFAARHAARLAGLVLADTRATADSKETLAARAAALEQLRTAGSMPYLAASLPRLLSPAAPPALAAHARSHAEGRSTNLAAGVQAMRDRPDRSGELAAIRCPTLVLVGDADQVTPPAEAQTMAQAIPNAKLVVLPQAGHISHLEAPGPFQRALSAFLSTGAAAGQGSLS
jgi:pimeloyl-ACP methyl ester carboxylesterase